MNRQPVAPAGTETVTSTLTVIERPARRHNTVNPYLTVKDVPALIAFITQTFDGVLTEQIVQEDGQVAHTEIRIGDSVLMVGAPQVDAPLPAEPATRPGTFYVYVPDVDATYRAAMTNGASSYQTPTNRFYGDRVAAVVDGNDNVWWIATKLVAFSEQQIQQRAEREWKEHPHGRD